MSFSTDKDAVIALAKAKSCTDAQYVSDEATDYDNLIAIGFEFVKYFDCDPAYLNSLLAAIDDTELMARGIYYNKTSTTLTNPKAIINSTGITALINVGGEVHDIYVGSNSTVILMTITNNTQVVSLAIGGGSVVTLLTVDTGSCVQSLIVKACATYNSILTKVSADSCIGFVSIDTDAVYGGIECVINPPV